MSTATPTRPRRTRQPAPGGGHAARSPITFAIVGTVGPDDAVTVLHANAHGKIVTLSDRYDSPIVHGVIGTPIVEQALTEGIVVTPDQATRQRIGLEHCACVLTIRTVEEGLGAPAGTRATTALECAQRLYRAVSSSRGSTVARWLAAMAAVHPNEDGDDAAVDVAERAYDTAVSTGLDHGACIASAMEELDAAGFGAEAIDAAIAGLE